MTRHILVVDQPPTPEKPRQPRPDELDEILDVVLAQVIQVNQGARNLLECVEERLVHIALEQALYKKTRAAVQLGIPRKQLERRAKKYQTSRKEESES